MCLCFVGYEGSGDYGKIVYDCEGEGSVTCVGFRVDECGGSVENDVSCYVGYFVYDCEGECSVAFVVLDVE